MAEFRRTNPDQRDDAVVSSQQVSWWSVHEHVAALLERVGSWPTAGTPAWCALDDDDPVKLAALCDAARQHVLRVEVAQEQLAEASRDVSAAEDWCARERATAAPRGLHPAGDRVMTTTAYGTSALNGQRYRRTKAELAEIDAAIYNIAEAEKPVTVRGLFYRVMSRGLVPKTEQGYSVVQRQALKMRAAANSLTAGSLTVAGCGSSLEHSPAPKRHLRTPPGCTGATYGLTKVFTSKCGPRRTPSAASSRRSLLNMTCR